MLLNIGILSTQRKLLKTEAVQGMVTVSQAGWFIKNRNWFLTLRLLKALFQAPMWQRA